MAHHSHTMRITLLVGCLAVQLVRGDYQPSRYTVDLGVAPEHRWDHVVAKEKDTFVKSLNAILNSPRVKPLVPLAKALLGNALEARRIVGEEQYREVQGIARDMGVDAAEIILVAVFYDMFAAGDSTFKQKACTGIVAQSSSGEIFHGRNLDYDFKNSLGPTTLVIDFARNNQTLFTAVTFGPNPTFNTAVRWGSFSLTQDERDTGNVLENVFDLAVRGRAATFSAIRRAMETMETFDDALNYLSKVKLSAASYFIMGGVKAMEGAVITRDRDSSADVWRLSPSNGTWYVVETNYDHWVEPLHGDNRRAPLERGLKATGAAGITASSMWDILSVHKVNTSAGERAPLNSMTIYSTIMQAGNPKTFRTVVRTKAERVPDAVVV